MTHLLDRSRLTALLATLKSLWNLHLERSPNLVLGTLPQSERRSVEKKTKTCDNDYMLSYASLSSCIEKGLKVIK